jgi:glycyl-tRNA synthetase alpha subunit
MSDDDELYDKLIAMWDERESTLDLQVQEIVDEMFDEIYDETNGDKKRCLAIFKKALENYNEYAFTYSALNMKVEEFEELEGEDADED